MFQVMHGKDPVCLPWMLTGSLWLHVLPDSSWSLRLSAEGTNFLDIAMLFRFWRHKTYPKNKLEGPSSLQKVRSASVVTMPSSSLLRPIHAPAPRKSHLGLNTYHQHHLHMGGCQNYGPFLGSLYNTSPSTQKGTINLITTHVCLKCLILQLYSENGTIS